MFNPISNKNAKEYSNSNSMFGGAASLVDSQNNQFTPNNFQSQSVLPRASHFAQQDANLGSKPSDNLDDLMVPSDPYGKQQNGSSMGKITAGHY